MEINYAQLRALAADIDQKSRTSPAFAVFNNEKINRFYRNNTLRIKAMNDGMQVIINKYCKDGR